MDPEQQIQHHKELAERRRLWEEQRKAEAEQRERQLKQARLEAFLASRRQAWLNHTGSLPTADTVEGWKHEYVAARADDAEAERALRLAEAANDAVL
jgi:hypothetical protein